MTLDIINHSPSQAATDTNATLRSVSTRRADANRRREALKIILEAHRLTPTELSRLINCSRPNALYNFLKGRSAALSLDMIERILTALPAISFEELVGWTRIRRGNPVFIRSR